MNTTGTVLIVGLGNPGAKFEDTRHNFGFLTVDEIIKRIEKEKKQKLGLRLQRKLKSEIAIFTLDEGQKLIIAKPVTFMNLSGEALYLLLRFFKPLRIAVIHDDLNLPLGTIRIRFDGESGGHKGVEDIIQRIGEKFWRIKLGIGPQPAGVLAEKFVLQRFSPSESQTVHKVAKKAAQLVLENIAKIQTPSPLTVKVA